MLPFILLMATLFASAAAPAPRTMRVDYYHTGNAVEERFSLDAVALEGEWPGRLDRLVDDTNLGKYLFEVLDRKTNRILYSRGFASIYGEWETTDEAKLVRRVESDLEYIETWSLWLDLLILFRTAMAIVTMRNAY